MADYRSMLGHNGGPALDGTGRLRVPFSGRFALLFEKADHKAFYGGRGSGKSHAVAAYLVIVAHLSTKRVVCARQYQNSLDDSSKALIEVKIRELGLSKYYKILDREIIHLITGSRFTFFGLERNPESIKSLEGADICWVEEARTINDHSMGILIPTIRKPGSEMIWTWNPEKPEDPVDKYFRGPVVPPNSIVQRVGIEDNPWFYHTRMKNEMWFLEAQNPLRYRHVWLGEYDESYDTKVFQNVRIGRVPIPPSAQPLYGMDFGFSEDPLAIVKVYVFYRQRVIYIAREFYSTRIPTRSMGQAIREVVENDDDMIRADSAEPRTIEQLQFEGFNVVPASKPKNSVVAGVRWLQGFEIVIDPDCEHMRDEARLYSWQVDRKTKKVLPLLAKGNDHLWDAVRYATSDYWLYANDDSEDENEEPPLVMRI